MKPSKKLKDSLKDLRDKQIAKNELAIVNLRKKMG